MRALVFAIGLWCTPAAAAPPPGVEVNPEVHAWFERQHNIRGGWCCNISDGHMLEDDAWRSNKDGQYEVLIDGVWYGVLDWQLRTAPQDDPNPTGHAIVWYVKMGNNVTIYCFCPGWVG
jgi:hypothetical protein